MSDKPDPQQIIQQIQDNAADMFELACYFKEALERIAAGRTWATKDAQETLKHAHLFLAPKVGS